MPLLEIRIIRCIDRDFVRAWSRLTDNPMSSPQWLLPWWEAIGSKDCKNSLALFGFYDQSQLVAVAPLYEENGQVLKLMGGGKACSDYLELVEARPGYFESAMQQLLDFVVCNSTPFKCLRLDHLSETSRTAKWIHDFQSGILRPDSSILIGKYQDGATCSVSLPDNWEDYLASLSKNHRKRCRRLQSKYIDSGHVQIVCTDSGWDLETAFDALVSLHNARRNAMQESGAFEEDGFTDFHRSAITTMAARGECRLSGILQNGRPLAAEYELLSHSTVFAYQSGLAPDSTISSVGTLSLLARIKAAIDEGRTTYDFLRGAEAYKFHWNTQSVPTYRFEIRPDTIHARLAHAWTDSLERTRSLRKSLLNY